MTPSIAATTSETEADFPLPDNFFSNYEPLPARIARELIEDAIGFYQFTEPMQTLIKSVAVSGAGYFVSLGQPAPRGRQTDQEPALPANPARPDHAARKLSRGTGRAAAPPSAAGQSGAQSGGRRAAGPPQQPAREPASARSPCTIPIHYFELPELFMEFICSMTGKSPSTTGAGSEGALTKGPFNALPPIIDLNNALVSFILTGHHAYVTAAGYVGPKVRVDHDVSLLVPEVWCRMAPEERDPQSLIAERCLEKCDDFEHNGKKVLAGRLGWRINARFVRNFFGRVFNHPHAVFTDDMLRPELQDLDIFVDGMDNIVTTQKRVAKMYFDDGSIEQACPPLAGAAAHHAPRPVGGQGTRTIRNSGKCSRANRCWRATGMPRGWRRSSGLTGSCGAGTWSIWTRFMKRQPRRRGGAPGHCRPAVPGEANPGPGRVAGLSGIPARHDWRRTH